VGDGGSTGSLATSAFVVQGALVLDRNDAVTLAQPVSGAGTLTQAGSGTLTLAGNNKTYTGDTVVANGVLATADSHNLPDSSAVVVQAAGRLTLGGSEILRSVTAQGAVVLAGDVTASEDLLLSGAVTVPGNQALKLTARRIDAINPGNIWGQSVSLDASERVTLASGTDGSAATPAPRGLVLGTVRLAAGGRIDAGTLGLTDTTTLSGGTLELVSSAAQAITAPGTDLANKQAIALPIAYAADAVQQTGGTIDLAAGAGLQVHAVNGGSISLTSAGNRFLGSLQLLSGAAFGTGWVANATPGDFGKPAPKGYALQGRVQVAGSTVVLGGLGIEADVISISADMLTTPSTNSGAPTLTARLPFDNTVGTEVSLPGLTLALSSASFDLAAPFGAKGGGEIRIDVGNRLLGDRTLALNAGYVTVLPRGGARGSTAVLLAGPAVNTNGYRFFFDGAGVQGEIPVFYNGLLPVTPAVESSISATVSVSESSRKERFDEAIRTENVAVRLRSGVIAEVGPGRPATQGSEGARGPATCTPAAAGLACEAAP
jgi:autotransporter-associated beta strand protein